MQKINTQQEMIEPFLYGIAKNSSRANYQQSPIRKKFRASRYLLSNTKTCCQKVSGINRSFFNEIYDRTKHDSNNVLEV